MNVLAKYTASADVSTQRQIQVQESYSKAKQALDALELDGEDAELVIHKRLMGQGETAEDREFIKQFYLSPVGEAAYKARKGGFCGFF